MGVWTDERLNDRFGDHDRRLEHVEDICDALAQLPHRVADATRAAAGAAEECRREVHELKLRLDKRDEERAREKAEDRQERRQDRRVLVTSAAMLLAAIIGAAAAVIAAGAHP